MPTPIMPNARVVQAIEKARTNDVKGVMSVKDAQTIAQTASKELSKARDKAAEAKAIGAALEKLPLHVGTTRAAHVLNVVAARVSNVTAMPAFHDKSDGKPADFEALTAAATTLLREATAPKRKNSGKDIPWDGPLNMRALAATSPPFAEQLDKEGLAYHRERGRDALTMIMTTLVQLGVAQGTRLSKGSHRAQLVDGIKARANGATTPDIAALQALQAKLKAGDAGPVAAPVAGQLQRDAILDEEGPPFVDAELIAPVRNALLFAFDLRKGPALETALTDVLAMGVEQGKRAAKGDDRNALLLDIAVDAIARGDVNTAKTIASML
jgi:hypothetical protein